MSSNLPATIGREELADLLGVHPSTISKLLKDGIVIRADRGAYDFRLSLRNYCGQMRDAASGRGGAEQMLVLTEQRARFAKEQADSLGLKNGVARGDFVAVEEVERTWGGVVRQLRSGLLSVPSRVKQKLPWLTAEDIRVIDGELRDAMTALGSGSV